MLADKDKGNVKQERSDMTSNVVAIPAQNHYNAPQNQATGNGANSK